MAAQSPTLVPQSTAKHIADRTAFPVLFAIATSHLLNDTIQSLIPAIYPLVKESYQLSFAEIGLITLAFQITASILQPLVGHWTDRKPRPFALVGGMVFTLAGLLLLAWAGSFRSILIAVSLVGVGSSIFHPEASRIARLAAGMRPGFAQSVFQVGGNAGSALGPLAAAFIVLQRGQTSIEWFAAVALAGMLLLYAIGRWYQSTGATRAASRKARAAAAAPAPHLVRLGMTVLIILMVSKFVYSVSFSSYYTFYLIEQFALTKAEANLCLFIFLAAVAAGTIIGGPIGDRIGRRRVILWSILGILPLTIAVPWLPLIPSVIAAALAGLMLASAFPAMVVYAQDLMPRHTGMVAGLMFGVAFGIAAFGAALLGVLADHWGIEAVYRLCAFLPLLGLAAFWLPDARH